MSRTPYSDMKIQYASDLHLEFRGYDNFRTIIKVSGDVLCLCGDICPCATVGDYNKLLAFLKYICPKYQYVLHITGNHEYYTAGERTITPDHTMQKIDSRLRAIERIIPNYRFMNGRMFEVRQGRKKYTFIGATLWSNISPANYAVVQNSMNDYRYIYVMRDKTPSRLRAEDVSKMHKRNLAFIKQALAGASPGVVILMTHHKPTGGGQRSELTEAYETDITAHLGRARYVIYGHTHAKDNTVISGTRYLSNPRGYPHERTQFDNAAVIDA